MGLASTVHPARYDGLPGWAFPARSWSYPTKDDVADYFAAYVEHFELPVRTGVRVNRLSRESGAFVLVSGDRRFEADNVVVATGAYQSPRIPSFARALGPGIVQLHSSEYHRPSQLQEGDTLVVGAGNSGAEIALEASHEHRVLLSGRDTGQEPARAGSRADRLFTPPFWFLLTRLLTVKTPMGRKARDQFRSRGLPLARVRRKDLAAAGIERVPRTAGVRDGMPVLDDGRVLELANVVWCTGFESDFAWIDLPVFDEEGVPLHDRGVVSSEPGLYFLGLYFLYAMASQLVGGAAKDAEYVVKHIASREAEGLSTAGGTRRLAKAETGGVALRHRQPAWDHDLVGDAGHRTAFLTIPIGNGRVYCHWDREYLGLRMSTRSRRVEGLAGRRHSLDDRKRACRRDELSRQQPSQELQLLIER